MADVFNADVYQFVVGNSAALGAALRAFHADAKTIGWNDVVRGIAEPVASSLVRPVPAHHEQYKDLMQIYAAREREALTRA
jgi:sugar (pentulose or hexulose) kinase